MCAHSPAWHLVFWTFYLNTKICDSHANSRKKMFQHACATQWSIRTLQQKCWMKLLIDWINFENFRTMLAGYVLAVESLQPCNELHSRQALLIKTIWKKIGHVFSVWFVQFISNPVIDFQCRQALLIKTIWKKTGHVFSVWFVQSISNPVINFQ